MFVGFFRFFVSALCRAACNACTQDAHPVEPAQLPDPPAEVAAEAPHFCIKVGWMWIGGIQMR